MDLEIISADMGVKIRTGKLPDGWWGSYNKDRHEIVLRARLGPTQRLSTLAHELGHAYYQHDGQSPKAERQASVWAALRLIKAGAFIEALTQTDNPQGLAHVLGVLPRDINNYISTLSAADTQTIRRLITQKGNHE